MTSIHNILDQHIEDAALDWVRREEAVAAPHYSLEDLATLDIRLEGNLDGLQIAELQNPGEGWQVCERELKWGEPGEVFAAAVLAFDFDEPARIDKVLDSASASYENSRALASALGWLPYEKISKTIDNFCQSQDLFVRRVGIAAAVAQDHDPGDTLIEAMGHSDWRLKARALRAVGERGRGDLAGVVAEHLDADNDHCRVSAAWSLARLLPSEKVIDVLQNTVERSTFETDAAKALQIVARIMDLDEAIRWTRQLVNNAATARLGIQCMGLLGSPKSIETVFEFMNTPALARLAGEAVSMITGIDLAYDDYEVDWPEGFSAGPDDDPGNQDVKVDPDENLPWPDVDKLKNWWSQHANEFEPAKRYLCGKPLGSDWLQQVVREGFQRQRAAAVLEMAVRNPGQPMFNVRAPGHRQQKLLGVRHTSG